MQIAEFSKDYVSEAMDIALLNYEEERRTNPILPQIDAIPGIQYLADKGIGVAAFEDDKMIGFLCFFKPWDEMFGTHARGTFSPLHGHGALGNKRELIYQKMYENIADQLVKDNAYIHAISLYAHDNEALQAFFTYGFGNRCMDEIRSMEAVLIKKNEGITCEELPLAEFPKIRDLRIALDSHLTKSPCFMVSVPEDLEKWLNRVEAGDRRTFVAKNSQGEILAYLDVAEEGETFITWQENMMNLQGAYCLPEYRGMGIVEVLLNYVISVLKQEGFTLLGVDHETFNPNALRFWQKYFVPYTRSVVRRVDECFKD